MRTFYTNALKHFPDLNILSAHEDLVKSHLSKIYVKLVDKISTVDLV